MNTPANPSTCQFTWRLRGELRLVQCRLPFGHGGTFHQCGNHVTAITTLDSGTSQRLPDWLPSHMVGLVPAGRVRPAWLDDHIAHVVDSWPS